ncbi:hypothetical protein IVA79_22380 [Bradyrhizobium sp. 138]|uniref:hypothetical protein n=1 Tax=Bradyrhizobium sp. 138 TaxID=2782615 RepID=UPI001FF77EE1|nr:hypothetical protein [Bradyrhizobium sp. 138]MCK1736625.1 hypothetical protein [Bradyrhizobium sp. 138]
MRVHRPTPVDDDQTEYMRQHVRECRELLKQPLPDTFLGRKTMDVPPKEEDADAG